MANMAAWGRSRSRVKADPSCNMGAQQVHNPRGTLERKAGRAGREKMASGAQHEVPQMKAKAGGI